MLSVFTVVNTDIGFTFELLLGVDAILVRQDKPKAVFCYYYTEIK